MAWFKVDDKLHTHPKWLSASPQAKALWTSAGSWSAAHRTDGHVPEFVIGALGGRPRDAQELADRGLWLVNDTGWIFHDWEEHQPLRDDLEAIDEKRGTAGKRGNHLRWHKRRGVVKPDCPYCEEEAE